MGTETYINAQAVALLAVAAAVQEKTAPAQALLKVWLRLAQNGDLTMRCRKATAWGCPDSEVREIARTLHAAVPFRRAAIAAGWRFYQ